MSLTGACEHRMFPGRSHRNTLGVVPRTLLRGFPWLEGGFRGRTAMEKWATTIAEAVRTRSRD